ncbi:hypothetical protein U9M48_001318 [Paspalum notatum var. saurae]|uniref:F-box domain-containing protein n=1 Tax=Paspalum notatum var. saurae TaxID=547442 RepID=A0AAQ3PJ86_PASNO
METAETTVAVLVLPDDVLAGILGRLPPRSLAASRCVCTSWRGLVDDRRLLLRHVLPHSVRFLFLNCSEYCGGHAHWLACPTTKEEGEGPRIRNLFRSILRKKPYNNLHYVVDHCNGLVLFEDDEAKYLCNPATRWWVRLPPCDWGRGSTFVVFDPAAALGGEEHDDGQQQQQQAEEEENGAWGLGDWPPPTWTCHVISSMNMEWEERVFVREGPEGEALPLEDWEKFLSCSGAYCHVTLYMLHCRGAYVTRLVLVD